MNKKALLFFYALLACLSASGQNFNLLIGTSAGPGSGEGIYVYRFDARTGGLTFRSKTIVDNPSYLAITKDRKYVYSVNQVPRQMGGVSAFSYNEAKGTLSFINKVSSGGEGPAYVSTDRRGRYAFAANYNSGTISAIPVNKGRLDTSVQTIRFTGSGPDPIRQTHSYMHCVAVTPDDDFLLANDLGADKTYVYKIGAESTAPLSPANPAAFSSQPGSGPRHLTFSPDKKFAYIVYEIGGLVNVCSYNKGKLKLVQTISIFPQGFAGKSTSADIHVSPDGKFVYASNRLDLNEIVILKVDAETGRLTLAGTQSTLGKTPRNFAIDPTGQFLLAANQDTNDIVVFRRDKITGTLTATGTRLEVPKPTCLVFGER